MVRAYAAEYGVRSLGSVPWRFSVCVVTFPERLRVPVLCGTDTEAPFEAVYVTNATQLFAAGTAGEQFEVCGNDNENSGFELEIPNPWFEEELLRTATA